MKLPVIYRFSIWCVAFYGLHSASLFSATQPPAPPLTAQGTPPVSQTFVSNSFESVELEKLRIAKEVGKLSKDDVDFNEAVVNLLKKLAEASNLSILPPSLPSELRTFLNSSASEVEITKSYYTKLASVLNKLSPDLVQHSFTRLI